MANIRDLAKMARVSVSTVSRVLNNHPYVREEKRLAVLGKHRDVTCPSSRVSKSRLLGSIGYVPIMRKG